MEKREITELDEMLGIYENSEYLKSNLLMGAKYKTSILGNKLIAISLSHLEYKEKGNSGDRTVRSQVTAAEIKALLNGNDGSFYKQINSAAAALTGQVMGMSNPETQSFKYISVIKTSEYRNGLFTVEYHEALSEYLMDIKKNYTILNLPLMLSFKNVYSFRLYELLRSRTFLPKNVKKNINKFKVSFSLAELKFSMGAVNADSDKVKEELANRKNPNYEKAILNATEQVYKKWGDFKKAVMDPAVAEINGNKLSDISISYTTKKMGQGGSVYQIDFIVTKENNDYKNEIVLTQEEKDEVLEQISELIEEPLKLKDIRSIAEAASYDFEKIETAYKIAKTNDDKIDNLTGFLIMAIKEEYELVEKKEKPKNKKSPAKKVTKNKFTDFEQHNYDYADLEKKIYEKAREEIVVE